VQPEQHSLAVDWARVYRQEAREAEHLANIASGQKWYGLANQLWAFEAHLKEQARQARADAAGPTP